MVKASIGVGFYRAEYKSGLNDEKIELSAYLERFPQFKGYLITEYLLLHPEIAKLCSKSVGCLRYVIGRKLNGELMHVYSFMRFGTKKFKFVENYNSSGVLAIICDGKYTEGNILDIATMKNVRISNHSGFGILLVGEIPYWNEIKEAAHIVAEVVL